VEIMTQGWNPFAGASLVPPQGQSGIKIIHNAPLGHTASSDVKIERCVLQQSQANNGSGLMYIVEYEILESTSHEDPPGAPRSWNQKRANEQQGLGSVRAFINAILGITHDQNEQLRLGAMVDQLMLYSTAAENPFRGYYVHVDNVIKQTVRGGHRFNQHSFSPFDYVRRGAQFPNFDHIFQVAANYRGAPPPAPVVAPSYGPPAQGYGAPQQQPMQQSYGPPQQTGGFAPQGQPAYGPPQQTGQIAPPQGSPFGGWRR